MRIKFQLTVLAPEEMHNPKYGPERKILGDIRLQLSNLKKMHWGDTVLFIDIPCSLSTLKRWMSSFRRHTEKWWTTSIWMQSMRSKSMQSSNIFPKAKADPSIRWSTHFLSVSSYTQRSWFWQDGGLLSKWTIEMEAKNLNGSTNFAKVGATGSLGIDV